MDIRPTSSRRFTYFKEFLRSDSPPRTIALFKFDRTPMEGRADTAVASMQRKPDRNVRLWLIADISKDRELGPLYPRKRTFARQSKKVC